MSSTITTVFLIFLQLTQNIGCYAECHCKKQSSVWENVKNTVKGASTSDLLWYGIKTAAVAGGAVVATPLVISAAGFGATGIAAGSVAAGVQATWFGGAVSGVTGGLFAGLQSIGAAGLGLSGKAAIVSASSAAVKLYDSVLGGSDEENCNCCIDN